MGRLRLIPEATPAGVAGYSQVVADSVSKRLKQVLDTGAPLQAGLPEILGGLANASTAQQTGFASDTYLANSSIVIPSHGLRAGSIYVCTFDMTKTAAGTAQFVVSLRIGAAGTTADTARVTHSFAVGTAAVDEGEFVLAATVRSINASTGTIVSRIRCSHHLAATGLITTGASGVGILKAPSSSFDTSVPTLAGLIIGLSVNGGASFSGTNESVQARLLAA